MNTQNITEQQAVSISDYLELLKKFEHVDIYRGHENSTWPLVPKIARKTTGQHSILDAEYLMINEFKKLSIPYLEVKPTSEIDSN